MNTLVLRDFTADMQIGKYSPVTIKDRLAALRRLADHVGKPLLECTPDDLRSHQNQFSHLSPATVNIYSRHIKAFYDWAHRRRLVERSPAESMVIPRVPRGRPHPTTPEDLRVIFSCTKGPLRMAYVLATFAGLRCGEICRLQRADLDLTTRDETALVHGKGGKDRIVPLLAPVIAELRAYGLPRTGWVVTRDGGRYPSEKLSIDSHLHLRELGLETTLHSMRGSFATVAGRATRDPMFIRDLMGHGSVATTEIYVQTSMNDAHERLAGVTQLAEDFLGKPARRIRLA